LALISNDIFPGVQATVRQNDGWPGHVRARKNNL
jgi:hypothetical protein